jgi:hypothetical protein
MPLSLFLELDKDAIYVALVSLYEASGGTFLLLIAPCIKLRRPTYCKNKVGFIATKGSWVLMR